MSRTPRRLPAHLRSVPIRSGRAGGRGLGRGTLAHSRFRRPFRGVARYVGDETQETAARAGGRPLLQDAARTAALNYLPLLRPGERFSHTFALLLHGVPIRCAGDLHVLAPGHCTPARRAGVIGHRRGALRADPDEDACGSERARHIGEEFRLDVRRHCVGPLEALVQSANLLPFRELVVAVDALILPRGWEEETSAAVPARDLVETLRQRRDRGIVRLRAAAEVAREGAESRFETLVRFELARMGLDDLELQVDICDDEGYWIGRFDLVDRMRKLIIEYDGEQHRTDRAQYLKDLRRLDRAREAGYRVLRLQKEDFRPERLAATRRRLCEFLGRAPIRIAPQLARHFAEC